MIKTEIETLQLKKLTPFPGNPQEVPEQTMSKITAAMVKSGWYAEKALIWKFNKKHYIISGNHRVKCAINAGIESSDCIVIKDRKYNWERAKTDVLRFNSLHGDFEYFKLGDFIDDILNSTETNLDELIHGLELDAEKVKEVLDIGPDNYTEDFELNSGDKPDFQQMTFILHDKQAKQIKKMLQVAKQGNKINHYGNENSNGNALYRVFKEWEKLSK